MTGRTGVDPAGYNCCEKRAVPGLCALTADVRMCLAMNNLMLPSVCNHCRRTINYVQRVTVELH